MFTAETIVPPLRETIEQDPAVQFAYLFGSLAKGRFRDSSDLDVAVFFDIDETGTSRTDAAERALTIEGRLEARFGRPAQVVVLDYAPPELIQNVLGHGRLVFSRNERARVSFYVESGRLLYDRAHARAIFERYRARRIREGTFGGRSRDG
ncbi:MAG: nucleotidyltransferase domain-containing protein [Gemmatimonadota bacterium]|nr:nucleotidyltransferase domain-containing protein [Gemmatimonadota bacterium]